MLKRITPGVALLSAAVALVAASCSVGSPALGSTPTLGELAAEYIRAGSGPRGTEVDITYAPEEFFLATGQTVPSGVRSSRELVFIYNESVHDGELPPSAAVVLLDATEQRVAPLAATVITEGGHHRSTRLVFPNNGKPATALTLLVLADDGTPTPGGELTWLLGNPVTTALRTLEGR